MTTGGEPVAGVTASVEMSVAALAVAGASSGAFMVATVSLRQALVPAELLGRVTSSYRLLGLSSVPVGAVLAGVVAGWWGLRGPYAVAAVVLALALGMSLPVLWGSSWPADDAAATGSRT